MPLFRFGLQTVNLSIVSASKHCRLVLKHNCEPAPEDMSTPLHSNLPFKACESTRSTIQCAGKGLPTGAVTLTPQPLTLSLLQGPGTGRGAS